MHEDNRFLPHQGASDSESYVAGYSGGIMLWQQNVGMTEEQAKELVDNLSVKPSLNDEWYRKGAIEGFKQARKGYLKRLGRNLPEQLTRVSPEGETNMALVVKSAVKADDRKPVWAKVSDLNQCGAVFEVLGITSSIDKWYFEIAPRMETLPDDFRVTTGKDAHGNDITMLISDLDLESEKLLISFTKSKGREDDMTAAKELIRQKRILYNVYIKVTDIGKGKIFYEPCFLPTQSKLYKEPPVGVPVSPSVARQQANFTIPGMDEEEDPFMDSDDLP